MLGALAAFIIAFFLALVATPACQWLAKRTGALVMPGERSVHREPIPHLGGLAIAIAFAGAVLIAGRGAGFPWVTVLLGGLLMLGVGIIDDVRCLRPSVKLMGQLAAAGILYVGGVKIGYITHPLGGLVMLGWMTLPITLIWVVGVVNVVNLSDGLDGLAAGISSIAALTLLYVAWHQGQPGVALLAAALGGSTLGFLPYNFNPARIFMGDGGSLFIGFILAAISMQGTLKSTAAIALLIPFLALGLPMFDAFFAVLRRAANGKPIYEADGGHLHHRLLLLGMTQRQVVMAMYMASLLLSSSAVLMTALDLRQSGLLLISIVAFMLLVGKRLGILEIKQEKDVKH